METIVALPVKLVLAILMYVRKGLRRQRMIPSHHKDPCLNIERFFLLTTLGTGHASFRRPGVLITHSLLQEYSSAPCRYYSLSNVMDRIF